MNAQSQMTLPAVPEAASGMVQMMERLALNPDLPVEKLEKLLDMQLRIRAMEAEQAFATALAEMQPKLPILKERGEVDKRYRYALWEDIVGTITPIMSEHGFSLRFRTTSTKDSVTVIGVLQHAAGHKVETELTLPMDGSGNKAAVQALGSSTSYGKRYTAGALLNLRMGDKDTDGVPPKAPEPKVSAEQIANIEAMVSELGKKMPDLCKRLQLAKIEDLPAKEYDSTIKLIERFRK